MSGNTQLKLLIFAILFISSCLAAKGQKKVIFRDRFCDNRNNWDTRQQKDFSVNIKRGAIRLEKKTKNRVNNGCLWLNKAIPHLKTDQNFSLSFKAVLNSWDDVINHFDIQWGSVKIDTAHRDQTQFFQRDFGADKVRLAKFDGSAKNPWTYHSWSEPYQTADGKSFRIDPGKKHHYTILQVNNILTVKINKMVVLTLPVASVSGGSIGVQQCVKSSWQMKKMLIRQ
ncbi:MAG TPA: hypothetical protein VL943_00575 [Niabella sp.]|nr:hypothetical protein [Niabella sp.]